MASETPEVTLARIDERQKALAEKLDDYQASMRQDVAWIRQQIEQWGPRVVQAEGLGRRVSRVEKWLSVTAIAIVLEVLGLVLIVLFQ